MKRVLLFLISLSFIIQTVNVSAKSTTETVTDVNDRFEILKRIDVVDWSTDGAVTRGEFAKITVGLANGFNAEDYAKYDSPFYDVNENTRYRNEIIGAYSLGIISGGGEFRPNDVITYNEVVKMLMSLMGYDTYASYRGGYPSGYLSVANELGIKKIGSGVVTRAGCAAVLLDALDAAVSEISSFEGNLPQYSRGDTLLYKAREMYKTEGVVEDNGITSINAATTVGKNSIVIGGTTYLNGYKNSQPLLGHNVYAYMKENKGDSDTLIYAYDHLNEVVTVSDEEFDDFEEGRIYYYKENSSNRKHVNFRGSVPVIYNGRVLTEYSIKDFDIENGTISFIDNDHDTQYDVIIITDYSDYFVLSASNDMYVVTDRNNNRRTIKLDDSVSDITIQNKNGVNLSYADITENIVLSVAASKDGKYAQCILSTDSVSGYVDMVSTDKYAQINGVEYKISDSMDSESIDKIKAGEEGTFYISAFGKIAGYLSSVRVSEFAYLVSSYVDDIPDGKAFFKLFLSNGTFVKLNTAKKYYVDGVRYDDQTLPPVLMNQQLVRYKTNANMEITDFDTAHRTGKSEFDTLADFGAMEDRTYWSRGVCMGGIVVPDSILIFSVPDADDNIKNEGEFEVMTRSQLTAGKKTMQFFNAKADSYVPAVMVLQNSGAPKISASADLGLVAKLERALNDEGDVVDRVHLLNSVGEQDLFFKTDGIVSLRGISEGDVIAYETNSKHQITAANIIIDYDKDNAKDSILRSDTDVPGLTLPSRSYDANFRVRYGYAYAKEGNVLTISDELKDNLDKASTESLTISTSMVYKVESGKKVTAKLINHNEIKDYIHFGKDVQMAIAFFQSTAPKMIVVFE
ncbi:MAG: S-layer homology domain-containing protein [Clostridia bacterium]|nr:S-layer homology domain-containing protein [Clostridia bacterium]